MEWREYIKDAANDFNPLYYYLAQIALAVVSAHRRKGSRKIKLEDFILNFKTKEMKKLPTTEREKREWMQRSKSIWLAALGVDKKVKS